MENNSNITPEQIVDILIRRRWYIIIPFILAMIVGIYSSLTLPKVYEAKTLILVQPQKVPSDFVQSVVSSDLEQRISTISEQIMSRTNLEKIINDFGLYTEQQKKTMYMEDMIGSLRRRISVDVTHSRHRTTDAFSISFKGQNPGQITKVTNALSSYFIDQNLKVREEQAIGTSKFLDDELTAMRAKLIRMEGALKQYREENMGSLPEQLDSNLRIADRLQEEINHRQNTLRDSKLLLISLNQQLEEGMRNRSTNEDQATASFSFSEADNLMALKRQLADLEGKYTPKHPDVIRLKRKIENLEDRNQEQEENQNETAQVASFSSKNNPFVQIEMSLLKEVEATNRDIAGLKEEITILQEKLAMYQKRIEEIPKKEQELLSLKRDYEEVSGTYGSLLQRKLEADLAVNMEKKQKGEQFRILDPAKIPTKPVEPNMKRLLFIAIAGGLGIGGSLIFLREYFNDSFKTIDDIETGLDLPVLAIIPVRLTPKVKFYKRANLVLSVMGGCISIALFSFLASITMVGERETLSMIKQITFYI
ncbi:Tyrosine-protein kinase (EC [Olavius algarvensis associated proteobacterium Delta 3]|nr:Tyrosine-protein kinase (EC [Olavius algarvensis associated proteobacterium Delta 3]